MNRIRIRRLNELDRKELDALLDRRPQSNPTVIDTCQRVISDVRLDGDIAVRRFTRDFDGVNLEPEQLRVAPGEFDDAENTVDVEVQDQLQRIVANIRRFHELQRRPEERWLEVESGVWCGERWTPIDRVCLYVPRGRGAFVSVACMLGVPAVLAGVPRVIVCTPPGSDGTIDPATLVACRMLEIDEVYRIGGAQAVAAVAFGTASVPRCDKIVGPGNVFVSAARQLLSDVLDPGTPAGPSESLIICDNSVNPIQVAWNLLVEAEHGENSTALLVTHSSEVAQSVADLLPDLLLRLTPQRRVYAETVLSEQGGVLLTNDLAQSIEFANWFAAEHVALMVADPWDVHPKITNAGEILFGANAIVSLANYAMGVNAILPTGGRARASSPVSVRDFLKMTSLGFCTKEGVDRLRPAVAALSRNEGFSAHHLSVEEWNKSIPVAGARL